LWISPFPPALKISIFTLIRITLRPLIPNPLVNPLIKPHKAALHVPINHLQTHYLPPPNLHPVVNPLIPPQPANIQLTFPTCAAIDLAARDVLEALQITVNPKLI
ncbi:flotillin-like FloA family protein, partial [Bacillus licheniformis]|uniref:flotillin-like FloA family protein n=1 Tax=Bacillus licheniformis TaxID=1402 RepID=UPI001642D964